MYGFNLILAFRLGSGGESFDAALARELDKRLLEAFRMPYFRGFAAFPPGRKNHSASTTGSSGTTPV
jgi:hypothetical protein